MCMQSRYPYEPTHCPSTKVSWLFNELFDNNELDDGLSLSASVAVNKQILKVILIPGNDTILMAYQINIHYNTYAHDRTFCCIDYSLCFVKLTPINDSLKEAF